MLIQTGGKRRIITIGLVIIEHVYVIKYIVRSAMFDETREMRSALGIRLNGLCREVSVIKKSAVNVATNK